MIAKILLPFLVVLMCSCYVAQYAGPAENYIYGTLHDRQPGCDCPCKWIIEVDMGYNTPPLLLVPSNLHEFAFSPSEGRRVSFTYTAVSSGTTTADVKGCGGVRLTSIY